ncbi:hypothetical protein [Hymenobacter glacieicola]|uniref:DUF4369 domain-containing protein n=1 Tax=Hymenobacter glacieicola TaxID=1562124 RepID=A0ABQ1X5R8_9BACT|nr:hypothetical protein [Hymenobacter glacieicola]GGG61252.1 hypothetical protein GCM10011378_41580 [Hymenobacter glacieicola]
MNREDYNRISPSLRNRIPAFPKGKSVTLRSLDTPPPARQIINTSNDTELRPQTASPMSIKSSAMILDPENGDVQIAGLGANTLQNGGTPMARYEPTILYFEFDETGTCLLGEKDKQLYEVAMLHPANKDNVVPGAPMPATGYRFEVVDIEKAADDDVALLEKALAVKMEVGQLSSAVLRETAQRIGGIDSTGTDAQIKKALYALCDANPENVRRHMSDHVTQNTALVKEAKEAGAIRFVDEKQAWEFVATAGLIYASGTEDPLLSLVDYLSTPLGSKQRTAIQTALDAAKKSTKRR